MYCNSKLLFFLSLEKFDFSRVLQNDIVRLLPQGIGQRMFLLVAKNYFTKWAEVEPYTQIKANQFT